MAHVATSAPLPIRSWTSPSPNLAMAHFLKVRHKTPGMLMVHIWFVRHYYSSPSSLTWDHLSHNLAMAHFLKVHHKPPGILMAHIWAVRHHYSAPMGWSPLSLTRDHLS